MNNTLEQKVDVLAKIVLCNDDTRRQDLLNSLHELMKESIPSKPTKTAQDILFELGAPENILGYKYAVYAINIAVADSEIIENITKGLYLKVAEKFRTTGSRVERAIRHLVEVIWDRGSFDALDKYFGNICSPNKGKPTNSEFISRIANLVRGEV